MITTQNEKAFTKELKELMKKYGVRIETEECLLETDDPTMPNELKQDFKFVGLNIDVTVEEFEFWRNISRDTSDTNLNSNTNAAAIRR